ncbi:hypothetical protein PG999_014552 [Apiospora kogelbergensis]|uniref:Uncharacterized protein n=1 Tax=Apiospora kogelbergensis TaxID=1337665 RepID=A0AAW0QEG9_9PEZI
MCRKEIRNHIYLGCKLGGFVAVPNNNVSAAAAAVAGPSGTQQAAHQRNDPVVTGQNPEQSTSFSRTVFEVIRANVIHAWPTETMEIDPPVQQAAQPSVEPAQGTEEEAHRELHKIRETLIVQCPEAWNNNSDPDIPPEKRHCPIEDMESMRPGHVGEADMSTPGPNAECPVCSDIEKAEKKALNTKLVVSFFS